MSVIPNRLRQPLRVSAKLRSFDHPRHRLSDLRKTVALEDTVRAALLSVDIHRVERASA